MGFLSTGSGSPSGEICVTTEWTCDTKARVWGVFFFFFWFPHLMCSRWMNWRQRSTGTKLFSVQFSKPQLKLSQIFLENTLGLVLPVDLFFFFFLNWNTPTLFASWSFGNFVETRPFCLCRRSFYSDVFVCFLFFWEQTMKPIISMMRSFCAKFSLIDWAMFGKKRG